MYTPNRTPSVSPEINITPFVDVMLVLLAVTLIAAPTIKNTITVNLPRAKAGAFHQTKATLVINKNRTLQLNGKAVSQQKLEQTLKTLTSKEILIEADRSISYGTIADILATAHRAGISSLGLVTIHGH